MVRSIKVLITVIILFIFTAVFFFMPLNPKFNLNTNAAAKIRINNNKIFKQNLWKFGNDKDRYLEAERIKQSVKNEMLEMVVRKEEVVSTILEMNRVIPEFQMIILEQDQLVEEQELKLNEYKKLRNVHLKLPKKPISPKNMQIKSSNYTNEFLTFKESIDYRKCSITSKFSFFLYPLNPEENDSDAFNLHNELHNHSLRTNEPQSACLFFGIVSLNFDSSNYKYWNNFGRNHILIFVNDDVKYLSEISAAVVVKSYFTQSQFRPNMDISAFLKINHSNLDDWKDLPQLLPHNRNIFLSFQTGPFGITENEAKDLFNFYKSANHSRDRIFIELNCAEPLKSERMALCGSKIERKKILSQSAFTVIYPNTVSFQQRIFEALEAGTIPVILSLTASLPFEEFIDGRKAVFRIPISRFPELHFILRSFSNSDILELRRNGRFFLQNYFFNTKVFVNTLISVLRYRLQMPGGDDKSTTATPLFHVKTNSFLSKTPKDGTFFPPISTTNFTRSPLDFENLGPLETPFPSKKFTHNFTVFGTHAYSIWNKFPFFIDQNPEFFSEDFSMPSEAEYFQSTKTGMRPIASGSGKEFSEALGGNRPAEQFTIVIVTHNRDEILKYQLQDLHEIPYLNRIIVVWNNIKRDPPLSRPKLNVPVYFVKAKKNSLNNRFLPFNLIETEAVLSLDDDLKILRHEIVFAFRVWRQDRTKIVGFPARYHYQNGDSIFYNSNYTCQHSMILTGAAFLHKNYFYAYTFWLPKIIHQKIDEIMNCEDIAMNFLVAHLTREPNIKVANKWSTLCPDGTLRGSNICPESLSIDNKHYEKRHECIRFFTKVFGYNPLMFSQFRVNSVLFWSKDLPKHHQKCFRYV